MGGAAAMSPLGDVTLCGSDRQTRSPDMRRLRDAQRSVVADSGTSMVSCWRFMRKFSLSSTRAMAYSRHECATSRLSMRLLVCCSHQPSSSAILFRQSTASATNLARAGQGALGKSPQDSANPFFADSTTVNKIYERYLCCERLPLTLCPAVGPYVSRPRLGI